eukprot:5598784-Prymnesium_polylepis.1
MCIRDRQRADRAGRAHTRKIFFFFFFFCESAMGRWRWYSGARVLTGYEDAAHEPGTPCVCHAPNGDERAQYGVHVHVHVRERIPRLVRLGGRITRACARGRRVRGRHVECASSSAQRRSFVSMCQCGGAHFLKSRTWWHMVKRTRRSRLPARPGLGAQRALYIAAIADSKRARHMALPQGI